MLKHSQLNWKGSVKKIARLAKMAEIYRDPLEAWRLRLQTGNDTSLVTVRMRGGVALLLSSGPHDIRVVNEIWRDGCYELEGFLPEPGWTVIDLGAHKGIFAARMLSFCPDITLRSYEPDPNNYRCLVANCQQFSSSVTDLHQQAVGATDGLVSLYRVEGKSGNNSLYESPESMNGSLAPLTVPKVSLADAIADCKQIDLLKIDVEAAEYELLLDTDPEVFAHVERIVAEVQPRHPSDPSVGISEVRSRLEELGFTKLKFKYPGSGDVLPEEDDVQGLGLIFARR